MLIRRFATIFVISKTLIIQKISIILFVIVFAAIWIEEWDNILSFIARAGIITLTLNITMMLIGFYVAKFLAAIRKSEDIPILNSVKPKDLFN